MEEVKKILMEYDLGVSDLTDYADHSHHPDMWSHTFKAKNKNFIFVEVEAVGSKLTDEDYRKLKEDLNLTSMNLKLISPRLEQMSTLDNQAGIGIDGHKIVTNADDKKRYKNPNGLDTGTTWILFELNKALS